MSGDQGDHDARPVEELARALVQAAIDSKVDDLLSLTTADATWWISGSTPWSGTYGVRELFARSARMFADTEGPFTGGITRIVATGDHAAVEAWGHVRFADGRVYHNEVVLLLQFAGGKVSSVKEYGDTQLLVQLFGAKDPSV